MRQREVLSNTVGESPWLPEQLAFPKSSDPVRFALGRPGSGKTSTLRTAIQARRGERVLCLTWSEEPRSVALQHLRTSSSSDTRVDALTFVEFLTELSAQTIPVGSVADMVQRFCDATAKLTDAVLGPWKDRRGSLYAEVRAGLIGRAVPGRPYSILSKTARIWHLSLSAYFEVAADLGSKAARHVFNVFHTLETSGKLKGLFPEFVGVAAAIERLGQGLLPSGLREYDRIVVDEVQDLTASEIAVLVEYARALSTQDKAPWILFAGDSGQTVRPTYFDWGALNGLLGERYAATVRTDLARNLRCPRPIAEIVGRTDRLYKALPKPIHPDHQLHWIECEPEPEQEDEPGIAP